MYVVDHEQKKSLLFKPVLHSC